MKKIICVLAMALLCLFCACCHGSNAQDDYSDYITPSIIRLGNYGYYYAVDKRTGVVYLEYEGFYRHAITVMLNADGTPVTAEQLGINLEIDIAKENQK